MHERSAHSADAAEPAIASGPGPMVPDLVAPGLAVLFVGINPGLASAATGHHFAGAGNRFWPVLHEAGFTPRRLAPRDQAELLAMGLGITNLVARTTATAAELSRDELRAGGARLVSTVERFRPRVVAFLGLSTYRIAFGRPHATVGDQDITIEAAQVWLLPNPSGLNAGWSRSRLAAAFEALRRSALPRSGA